MPQTFLLKSEPDTYSIDDLKRDGQTAWDGVRNHTAKLHLMAMQVGDKAYLYHSGDERQVVGVAEVVGAPRPDPTDATGKFVCVDIRYVRHTAKPVPLKAFKEAQWNDFDLVRLSRLSVMKVPADVEAWITAQEA